MIVKKHFDTEGIENFIPMRYKERLIKERRHRRLVPAVHNLIFVRTTRELLQEIKSGTKLPIRYMMDRDNNKPLTIPDKQMQDFIAVTGTFDEQLVYLDPTTSELRHGDRVRITGGLFQGVEGEFMRICGDRRVVVNIQGVMAVATAFIHPSMIEKTGQKGH